MLKLLKKIDFNADNILWDVHLMVKEPIDWIEKCLFIGASRIIGQVEMMTDRNEFVKRVKDIGAEAGLAFDIETEVKDIPEETDVVLLMGRKAGFGEYPLDERIFKKIVKAKIYGKLVAMDGGADVDNIEKLKAAGVEIIYSEHNYEKINDYTNP